MYVRVVINPQLDPAILLRMQGNRHCFAFVASIQHKSVLLFCFQMKCPQKGRRVGRCRGVKSLATGRTRTLSQLRRSYISRGQRGVLRKCEHAKKRADGRINRFQGSPQENADGFIDINEGWFSECCLQNRVTGEDGVQGRTKPGNFSAGTVKTSDGIFFTSDSERETAISVLIKLPDNDHHTEYSNEDSKK